jgi:hypothetical protein
MGKDTEGRSFDVSIARHAVCNVELGTNSECALDLVGRSQNLPDAYELLANNPAFKQANIQMPFLL